VRKKFPRNLDIGKNNLSDIRHYAIIPARKNSIGLPFKNRKFFDKKFNFLKKMNFFNDIIVSTNDDVLIKKCIKREITFITRSEKLSGSKVPIKSVFIDIIKKFNFSKNDILWLFYIPLVFNSTSDIKKAKNLIEINKVKSICGFTEVKTHPFNTWQIKKNYIKKFYNNDVFRRQDLPKLFEHHHHICAFDTSKIKDLNSELIGKFTYPFILSESSKNKIIELDTKDDYLKYLKNEKKT
jgi:CMP-N-acetylneuraminic acid synthetase